eukprot:1174538-Lingulodinium_polyedra.AAC.1
MLSPRSKHKLAHDGNSPHQEVPVPDGFELDEPEPANEGARDPLAAGSVALDDPVPTDDEAELLAAD